MKLILLILLPLLIQPAHSQYCPTQRSFDYSAISCVFQYDYSDVNCTEFQFKECLWIECVDWVTVGNDTYCDQTELFYDYNWNYCTYQCCDSSATYPYEQSSINQCQEYLNHMQTVFIIIMSSFFGGILLIVLVIFLCKCSRNECGNIRCQECLINLLCLLCCLCLKGRRGDRIHSDHHIHLRASLSQEPDKGYYGGQKSTPTSN